MHLGSNNPKCQYKMGDAELDAIEAKDLGVYICNDCKSSVQCTKSAQKAMNSLRVFKRTFRYTNKESFSVLYKTYIGPHLEYCIQAWKPGMKKDIHTLEKIQRRATKLVPSIRHLNYHERLDKLNLLSLEQRRLCGDMIETFKILHGFDKIHADRFFKFSSTTETRGHNMKLFKTGLKKALSCRQEFLTQRVINTWNSLPASVVNAKSVNSFKSGDELDNFWKRYGVQKAFEA